MPHYVYLGSWTSQGAKDLKDSGKRAEAFTKEITAMGGTTIALLHTMGPHDVVVVAELPNDEAANLLALRTASKGFVSTLTLKGWTNVEYVELLKKV
ncbi:MAG: GYD domain-containing protein [Thermoplasmata archaeon]